MVFDNSFAFDDNHYARLKPLHRLSSSTKSSTQVFRTRAASFLPTHLSKAALLTFTSSARPKFQDSLSVWTFLHIRKENFNPMSSVWLSQVHRSPGVSSAPSLQLPKLYSAGNSSLKSWIEFLQPINSVCMRTLTVRKNSCTTLLRAIVTRRIKTSLNFRLADEVKVTKRFREMFGRKLAACLKLWQEFLDGYRWSGFNRANNFTNAKLYRNHHVKCCDSGAKSISWKEM